MTPLKVLSLGGTGDMGRHAAATLSKANFVSELIVAGLPDETGERFVRSLGPKASFRSIDIYNAAALDALIASVDLVVNTAGPFFRVGPLVTASALRVRKPYFDICDDVQPTLSLLDMSSDVEAAGVPFIVGLGLSPGITNLLARMAVEALDAVHSLDTSWDLAATVTVTDGYEKQLMPGAAPAAIVHWMHVCSGMADILEGGQWVATRPVEPHSLNLPEGNMMTGWSVAHPETVTLPRTFQTLSNSRNFMTGGNAIFDLVRSMRDKIDSGTLSSDEAAAELAHGHDLAASMTLDEERAYRTMRNTARPFLTAIARGTKDGKDAMALAKISRLPPGGMGGNTGIPVAIGAQLYAEGHLKGTGVFTPEAIIDPKLFFERFEPYCDPATDQTPLVEVIAWNPAS
jgi:saccharopine dehydrogenase-like NADP-dependent oxidoreductase